MITDCVNLNSKIKNVFGQLLALVSLMCGINGVQFD